MNTLHRDEKMLVNRGMAEIDWLHKRVIREIMLMAALLLLALLLVPRALAQEAITVYTVSGLPVPIPAGQRSVTRVIELDRIVQIENALASGLEKLDPEVAVQTARSRLTDRNRQGLILAWQGLARVQGGEMAWLPAIVFDGKAVWYGTDFRRGLAAYRARCPENQECQP